MTYLGLDLGNKKCWLAIELNWIVFPKWIIQRTQIVNKMKKLVKEYSISTIVVWMPYDLYWNDLKQADKTSRFIEKIKIIFPNINIDSVDERFTSFEADNIMRESNENKSQIDDISAVLILESYLKSKK